MKPRKLKYSWKQVRYFRRMLSRDKDLTIKEAAERAGIAYMVSRGMYRNVYPRWYDAQYKPVPRARSIAISKGVRRARAEGRARHVKRKPSIEYSHHCTICGMGYDTEIESKGCCR